jgi:DNA-binding IscR family transcriptional regulator
MELMRRIVDILLEAGLLRATADEPESYLPARPLDQIRVTDILLAVRSADESPFYHPAAHRELAVIEDIMQQMEHSLQETLQQKNLRQLVENTSAASVTDESAV